MPAAADRRALGVRQEFQHDAAQVGIELRFIRSIKEADETGIYLTTTRPSETASWTQSISP